MPQPPASGTLSGFPSHHSDSRLRLALAAGNMGAWQWDFEGRGSWWSPEMFTLHGLPVGERPADYWGMIHPHDREHARTAVEESIRRAGEHYVQYRILRPDGAVRWIEGRGHTIRNAQGQPVGMIGVCVDIDERKRDELDLRFLAQASTELASLTDAETALDRVAGLAVPHFADWCAIDMIEGGNRLRRVAVAHVDAAKLQLARDYHERWPPDPSRPGGTWEVARSGQPLLVPFITDEMIDQGVPDVDQRAIIRALGLYSYMGVPIVAQGHAQGVITFIASESRRVFSQRDLDRATDLAARAAIALRNAELLEALRRVDAAKDMFLATLAHELRNPLAPITASLSVLRHRAAGMPELQRSLAPLQRQTAQLTRLVDDLLDLARINSGKIELRMQAIDLQDVVRSAVEQVQPQVDQAGHLLSSDVPSGSYLVHGDAVRLTQVVANLLGNSVRYTPRGGELRVSLRSTGERHTIAVCDNGMGIPSERIDHIFAPFVQGAPLPGAERQGLGVGLFLVRRLVDQHGGTVRASSAGAGKGSRFEVELPALQAA